MKALSVRAPWWWAILNLGKDIENRDRYCGITGTVYLHASKWWSMVGIRDEWKYSVCHMASVARPHQPRPELTDEMMAAMRCAGGCLVGKVDILGCVMDHKSPWFAGKFGFILANAVALPKPIPFKGALGFFEVPDGIDDRDTPAFAEAPQTAWAAKGAPLFFGLDLSSRQDESAVSKGVE